MGVTSVVQDFFLFNVCDLVKVLQNEWLFIHFHVKFKNTEYLKLRKGEYDYENR